MELKNIEFDIDGETRGCTEMGVEELMDVIRIGIKQKYGHNVKELCLLPVGHVMGSLIEEITNGDVAESDNDDEGVEVGGLSYMYEEDSK